MNIERKFYEFRKRCVNGVLVNNEQVVSIEELKESIDNIVESLIELSQDRWIIVLDKESANGNDTIYIEKI